MFGWSVIVPNCFLWNNEILKGLNKLPSNHPHENILKKARVFNQIMRPRLHTSRHILAICNLNTLTRGSLAFHIFALIPEIFTTNSTVLARKIDVISKMFWSEITWKFLKSFFVFLFFAKITQQNIPQDLWFLFGLQLVKYLTIRLAVNHTSLASSANTAEGFWHNTPVKNNSKSFFCQNCKHSIYILFVCNAYSNKYWHSLPDCFNPKFYLGNA